MFSSARRGDLTPLYDLMRGLPRVLSDVAPRAIAHWRLTRGVPHRTRHAPHVTPAHLARRSIRLSARKPYGFVGETNTRNHRSHLRWPYHGNTASLLVWL